jgi:hypothetical protein
MKGILPARGRRGQTEREAELHDTRLGMMNPEVLNARDEFPIEIDNEWGFVDELKKWMASNDEEDECIDSVPHGFLSPALPEDGWAI